MVYSFSGFGPVRTKLLLDYFGSSKYVWEITKKKLGETGLTEKLVQEFIAYRDKFDEKSYFNRLKNENTKTTTLYEDLYPQNLKLLKDAPVVLYYKGEFAASDESAVSIVGSRKMTSYGKTIAHTFSSELAEQGLTIVSGLAFGIDTVAHTAALSAKGRTIAVIASGIDTIYPASNKRLSEKIIENGVVMTEYPLGYPALRQNFVSRNRIVSGISKAVLVVEGKEKSGTLITARHAAEQGKDVYAVPGPINSPLSFAPNFLIKEGCKVATSPKDILDGLDLDIQLDIFETRKIFPEDEFEESILRILENEGKTLDEIVLILQMDSSSVLSKLSMMELKGSVHCNDGSIYTITSIVKKSL